MTGRIGIDFGTSNTVISFWNAASQQGQIMHLEGYGKWTLEGENQISVIPSLIHYGLDGQRYLGNQVFTQQVVQSPRTLRWMKRYISQRSPIKIRIDGEEITPYRAGQEFLSAVLFYAIQQIQAQGEEIAFSTPVEAYEHYENWLAKVAADAGASRYRLIDEPSAAALGYGAHIQPGNVYLIFDFGGGTMHAAVVLMEDSPAQTGRRCRVLGKAGKDIGGTSIDQWLYEYILQLNNKNENAAEIRRISNSILVQCELAKQQLSFSERADFTVMDPDSGSLIAASLDRGKFEEILDQHELFNSIHRTIRSAINSASEKGYNEDSLQSVLLVGGSSQIPSVQRTLRQIFGNDRVYSSRPLDAVARGAATFAAGVDFFDYIQHDYAIRHINSETGSYEYRTIVQRGTPYPTEKPVARLVVKASYDGQQRLGLAIFEIGENRLGSPQPVELVFDPSGAARIVRITPDEQEHRSYFWMNEKNPTFLVAEPVGIAGEPRFEVEFYIDQNKQLTITVQDLKTKKMIHKNYPVINLV